MTSSKHVEQHANTLLAHALRWLGIDARAETKGQAHRKIFDLSVRTGGLLVVMEAEYNNPRQAAQDADKRLSLKSPPDILGAISYAPEYEKNFHRAAKEGKPIQFAFKRAEDGKGGWDGRWQTGAIYDLAQALRRPHALARPSHDSIAASVARIKEALKNFCDRLAAEPAAREDIPKLLQASLPVAGDEKEVAIEQSIRLAGLILVGAFLFQFALAAKKVKANGRQVKSPKAFESPSMFVSHIEKEWRFILEKINYAAIFRVAVAVMQKGNVSKSGMMELARAAKDVEHVARDGVDLMGVVYHELLAELAKPLGAYYTTIPAATMLSALALAPRKWDSIKWQNCEDVAAFRVADLACGSGTLLAAACGQIRDNVMRAHLRDALDSTAVIAMPRESPLEQTQRDLLENVIWGYDVLDAAVHLTATTLGLMSPEVDFRKSHIYRAALGLRSSGAAMTGSFQLLESKKVSKVLFSPEVDEEEKRIAHVESGDEFADPLPLLDACIMNPPFVVGRKNALSYSFLPPHVADKVRYTMNMLAKTHKFSNAGLGPGFAALGEKYIKPGGRMALVMTSTVANGRSKAWAGVRARIEKTCDLEHLIISREPGKFNFSHNTNLQECMIIVRKRENGDKPKTRAMFSVLSANPQDGAMAYATARAILDAEQKGKEWGKLRIAGRDIGEFALLRYRDKDAWDGTAFTNLRLTMAADMLADSGKMNPYSSANGGAAIPMRPLGKLASFGSYRLHRYTNAPEIEEDARRYLSFSKTPTRFAGYYPGHYKRVAGIGQKDVRGIKEEPNCYFLPLPKCQRWADKYFAWGGRVVINVSFGFNSSRRLASLISMPVQGANYQPVRLHNDSDERAKAMVLWLNSTPCTMLIAVNAVGCGRSKVMFSKQAASDMPVLDLDALNKKQLTALARAFDKIAAMEFMPMPQMAECPARKAVDDALAKILNLPDFNFADLRAALAAEPIITGK